MNKQGFTLIELVVALSIFGIFTAIMMSIFTRFITTERREVAQQALQEDVHYALETFNREVRTAYGNTFIIGDTKGSRLYFNNQNGDCVQYAFIDHTLKRGESASGDCSSEQSQYNLVSLTSKDTLIDTDSRFDPVPAEVTAGKLTKQGFVTVIVSATSRKVTLPPLQLQSTMTSQQVIPL